MKQIVPIAFVVMIAATAPHLSTVLAAAASARAPRAPKPWRMAAGTVKVTLNYKGKGTVDGSHRVWVWLFTSPDIGPELDADRGADRRQERRRRDLRGHLGRARVDRRGVR